MNTETDIAVFCGIQPGYGALPTTDLWTLKVGLPGYTAGSTVIRQTIELVGHKLPPVLEAAAERLMELEEDRRRLNRLDALGINIGKLAEGSIITPRKIWIISKDGHRGTIRQALDALKP
jgi:hypothetical protein